MVLTGETPVDLNAKTDFLSGVPRAAALALTRSIPSALGILLSALPYELQQEL